MMMAQITGDEDHSRERRQDGCCTATCKCDITEEVNNLGEVLGSQCYCFSKDVDFQVEFKSND